MWHERFASGALIRHGELLRPAQAAGMEICRHNGCILGLREKAYGATLLLGNTDARVVASLHAYLHERICICTCRVYVYGNRGLFFLHLCVACI